MYVPKNVCIYVHTYVCTYICAYICMYACTYALTYVYIHKYSKYVFHCELSTHTHTHTHTHMNSRERLFAVATEHGYYSVEDNLGLRTGRRELSVW